MRRPALSEEEIAEIARAMVWAIRRVWPPSGGTFTAAERLDPDWRVSFGEELEEQEAWDAGFLDDGADMRDANPRLALAAARARMATGQALSHENAELIQKALRKGNGRAKQVSANYGRDHVIVELVEHAERRGLKRTRNETFRDSDDGPISACAVVALLVRRRGVDLSEAAIEKIVTRHRRLRR